MRAVNQSKTGTPLHEKAAIIGNVRGQRQRKSGRGFNQGRGDEKTSPAKSEGFNTKDSRTRSHGVKTGRPSQWGDN